MSARRRLPKKTKPPRRDPNEAAFDVMQRIIQRTEKAPTKKRPKPKARKRD